MQITDPEGFDDEFSHFIPVSSEVVAYTIDLLQCFIAQYRHDDGCKGDDAVWDRLAATAGHALAGLLSAHSAYYHDRDARALVEQIAFFCLSPLAPQRLEPLREPDAVDIPTRAPQAAEIIAALVALWEQNQRQHNERLQQRAARPVAQPGRVSPDHGSAEGTAVVSQQEAAPQQNVGWEY
jgi:hypothetical protein